ncbi:MAG: flagellar basal body rod protein FlgC [Armatimonadetes bacterium]|nr:flagellar basal body rod protein FlgC [Armatimonadota bacterium]
MSLFSSMRVSASGLTAERARLDVIAGNLANANTTRTPDGGPFVRQLAVLASREASAGPTLRSEDVLAGAGVRVLRTVDDTVNEMRRVYEPGHPDADAKGYVTYPNVNVVTEMVDMISATRAYEANIAAVNAAKTMAMKSLEIGK